jgi:hypothetical protein
MLFFASLPLNGFSVVSCFVRPSYTINLQPEVISHDQWNDLKADTKGGLSTWIKGAFHGSKSDIQDSLLQNLFSILSTSPMWDR